MLKVVAKNEVEREAWKLLLPYVRELYDIVVGERAVDVRVHINYNFKDAAVAGLCGVVPSGEIGVWVKWCGNDYRTRRVLAHEFIHVDQHVSGKFKQWSNDYNISSECKSGNREVPWEIEARRLEVALMDIATMNIEENRHRA